MVNKFLILTKGGTVNIVLAESGLNFIFIGLGARSLNGMII
jgi:hypothetical protein